MFFKKLISISIILLLQTSCAVNLKSLVAREKELKNRDDFNAYLAIEYLEYSRDLANKYNWRDSDYFAKKGLMAINNKEIFPEVPEAWDIDSSQIEATTLSRKRLLLLMRPKVKESLSIQLAHLVLLYDCWVSKENQPWQLVSMSKCKLRFFKLVTEMEEYIEKLKISRRVKEVEIREPSFNKFDIYFDFNSYKFNESADEALLDLLLYLKKLNGDYRLLLVGSTDRAGKKLYNDRLARERVLSTQNRLIKNGVAKRLIEIKSLGERKPQIVTKDGGRNKVNRRVSVYVLGGQNFLSDIPLPLVDNYIYKQKINDFKNKMRIKN